MAETNRGMVVKGLVWHTTEILPAYICLRKTGKRWVSALRLDPMMKIPR